MLIFIVAILLGHGCSYSLCYGGKIRITFQGVSIVAEYGRQKIVTYLNGRELDSIEGKSYGFKYSAERITINHFHIPRGFSVKPVDNSKIELTVNDILVEARTKVKVKTKIFRKTSDVKIKGSMRFNPDFTVGVREGRPNLEFAKCNALIGDFDVKIHGGFLSHEGVGELASEYSGFAIGGENCLTVKTHKAPSWIVENLVGLFRSSIKKSLEKTICNEAKRLVNDDGNKLLKELFERQMSIKNIAILDVSLQTPTITSAYIDIPFRGEFFDAKNPEPSVDIPNDFDGEVEDSSKHFYVWLSDFTFNTAAKVVHKNGLLHQSLVYQISKENLPVFESEILQSLLNELIRIYHLLEVHVTTNKPPLIEFTRKKVNVCVYARVSVVVKKADGSNKTLFYLDTNVDTSGSIRLNEINQQYVVSGELQNVSFSIEDGGCIFGQFCMVKTETELKNLYENMMMKFVNPILNRGMPLPKVKDFDYVDPDIEFVTHAVRIGMKLPEPT